MVHTKVTLWLSDADDESSTCDDESTIAISREDHSVMIVVPGEPQTWEVFIDPSLFGRLRAAMNAAEGRSQASSV